MRMAARPSRYLQRSPLHPSTFLLLPSIRGRHSRRHWSTSAPTLPCRGSGIVFASAVIISARRVNSGPTISKNTTAAFVVRSVAPGSLHQLSAGVGHGVHAIRLPCATRGDTICHPRPSLALDVSRLSPNKIPGRRCVAVADETGSQPHHRCEVFLPDRVMCILDPAIVGANRKIQTSVGFVEHQRHPYRDEATTTTLFVACCEALLPQR